MTIETALLKEAIAARQRSHSPYSLFKVGAALALSDGTTIVGGCNIENASYGATVCAERVAIWKAVASHGTAMFPPVGLLVLTDQKDAWPPCGQCLQVMSEFFEPQTPIYLANLEGVRKTLLFSDLMPHAFTPERVLESN